MSKKAVKDIDRLKPCPFCGSKNLEYEFSSSQGYVKCNACGTLGPEDPQAADPICDIDAAFDIWNKRVGGSMANTLTCVYCGTAYPEGTPPHRNKILTEHIKHPTREDRAKILKLRNALLGLVDESSVESLNAMETLIGTMSGSDADKAILANAIYALVMSTHMVLKDCVERASNGEPMPWEEKDDVN